MEILGRTLGNYRIEALLGSGRLGRVYRATNLALERPAALKIFHEQFSADPTFRDQLLRQANRLIALRNPFLVEVFDAAEADGLLYLAMEYCDAGSIGRLVREAAGSGDSVPLETSLALIDQATDGLEYAHNQGFIHGDITPNNLLLTSNDGTQQLKIGDLGLFALGDATTSGSRAYRSPEQRRGEEPDERSDVYALGVVLYQLATGRLPFGVDGDQSGPPAPRDLKPELSRPLEEVILRCLAERPDDRYGSAAKLGIALRTLSLSGSVQDAASTALPPLARQYVPRAAVRLIARDHRVALAPGETRQLRVTVENAGSAADEFLVAIEPSPVVQTEEVPRRVRLDAEQQELVSLAVSLDRDSRIVPGEYRLRILAHAALSEAVNDTAFAAAVILPQRPGPLTIRQMGASSGAQREYQLDLFNEGGTTAHYTLAASDPEHLLSYRFNADIVTVEPGRSRTIVLSVRDRRRRTDGIPVQFLVVATPAHGEPLSATANFNRLASGGYRPFTLLSGLAAVLAVVLIGTIFMLRLAGSNGNDTNAQERPTGSATNGAGIVAAATPTASPVSTPSATPSVTPPAPPTATATVTPTPSTQTPLTVRQVTTDKHAIALTFSLATNDETPAKLRAILATLKQANIHATFGFRGDWAVANPDLVKEIVAGGHQLINATYDYQSFTGESTQSGPLSTTQIVDELTRDAQVIKQITGIDMAPYYRPPYGDTDTGDSTAVADAAAKAGYSVSVLWSIDTESWAEGRTVADMVASANKAEPGDIILFNITKAGGNKDVDALPQIIRDLRDKGFSFATVKELVGR